MFHKVGLSSTHWHVNIEYIFGSTLSRRGGGNYPWEGTLAPAKPNWVEACPDTWLSREEAYARGHRSFLSTPVSANVAHVGTLSIIMALTSDLASHL
jgi:hypothetical protein